MFGEAFADCRTQFHWLAQLPSAAGKLHGAPHPLWHQVALRWDDGHDALMSCDLGGVRAGLRFDGCLLVGDDAWSAEGRTLEDAKTWMEHALARHGLEGPLALRDAETMPAHAVVEGVPFDWDVQVANTLRDLYHHAHEALEAWRAKIGSGPVLVWAHHFDIATLQVLQKGERDDLEDAITVGYGMSPGDGANPEPYGYVNFWPTLESPELPPLPVGRWNTKGWLGTVLDAADNDGRDTLWAWLEASRSAAESLLLAPQV